MTAPARHGTFAFFALTFAITWGLQLPGVLAQRGVLPGDPNAYLPAVGLGIFGPLVAATWLTFRQGRWDAVRALYGRLLLFRVHPGWYALALLVPATLLSGGLALLNVVGRTGPVAYFPAAGALVFGVVISVAEEVGWRGYALPRLERRFGAFAASTLLGVLWCLWHVPMFLGLGVPMNLMLVMMLHFTGASLLMTFIARGTGGSLLLAVIAHLAAHVNNSHRALPGEVVPLVVHAIVYGALGLALMRSSLSGSRPKGRASTAPPSEPIRTRAWKRPGPETAPASLMW
jgi:membrane protease YdiL (CAAX protease family)